ncbi:MAG TPA: YkgJ family cysteine cluster protein [Spirochaetota bacterium]|jgi:Fe-S-cluster containining protein|nr:YkgJ family cysteine cluster protein [Spirochaetota bacterium]OQA98778.1 MAG: Flagellin N-methylase [Spirochaetes bacterium ADurb.Bin218]HOK02738.1 YkgJ family cysteine cluster protein [Spirochaetota bacterium]HOK92789.1 YkgJ family cysteine cluster protein [Spirochaetota bacterium]HON16946.1 YkgJ family cysteine cluster protein [Spirochaetota bacterium]
MKSLELYSKLIVNIDEYEKKILAAFSKEIKCKKGCDECCILTSVFPVEAYVIYKSAVSENLSLPENFTKDKCVFLYNGQCSIYKSRPIICRTHGYPIFYDGRVDFCPKNFTEIKTMDSGFMLNLDAVNRTIASINIIFVKEVDDPFFRKERISLTELYEYISKTQRVC